MTKRERPLAGPSAVHKHFAALLWAADLSMSALCRPLRLMFRGPSVWHVASLKGPLNGRATGVVLKSLVFRTERAVSVISMILLHIMLLFSERRLITIFSDR